MAPQVAIRCSKLVKVYPGGVTAVRGLDLEVLRGECFGILGPNGAGKTTTIEIIEGLLAPTSGEVEVLGRRWGGEDREIRSKIGISLQETRLSERLTVKETVRLFRSFYPRGLDPLETIELVGLREKAGARVGKLSGGQRQRLALATALVGDPELLFLDEPTTGLDPQSRLHVWDILRRYRSEGRTILITTHYMDEAERLCDRVLIVDYGQAIALGSPRDLIQSLGGEHVIEVTLPNGAEAQAALGARAPAPGVPASGDFEAELKALPSVCDVRRSGNEVLLTVGEPQRVLPVLLEKLRERGAEPSRLSVRQTSLEDVFVKLTGRHIRDGGVLAA